MRLYSVKKAILYLILSFALFTGAYANEALVNNNEPVKVYPNPAIEFLQMDLKFHEQVDHIRIYDGKGSLKEVLTSVKEKNNINLKDYEPGRYLIVVFSESGIHKNIFEVIE